MPASLGQPLCPPDVAMCQTARSSGSDVVPSCVIASPRLSKAPECRVADRRNQPYCAPCRMTVLRPMAASLSLTPNRRGITLLLVWPELTCPYQAADSQPVSSSARLKAPPGVRGRC
jgi:hypothetical protein